jgi:L-asparagine permease
VTSIVDVTAAAHYLKFWSQYWQPLQQAPQWALALIALVVVLSLNLVSVKLFGEMEFWFARVNILALVGFLLIGVVFILTGTPTDAGNTGVSIIADNGGFFPTGGLAPLLASTGVIFAYAGIELIGTAAGETAKPAEIMPKAINTVVLRIAVFYVGSVLLLSRLLPFTAYKAGESPFVTFFSHLGNPDAGVASASVMNFVVLTASLSSLNAGLYSTGRILRSMALNGSADSASVFGGGQPYRPPAPKHVKASVHAPFTVKVDRHQVVFGSAKILQEHVAGSAEIPRRQGLGLSSRALSAISAMAPWNR